MNGLIAGLLFVLVLCIGILVALFAYEQAAINSFKQHCTDAGGHVYQPAIVLCVTDDGRLVEVYP